MNEWERLHQQAKRYQTEYPPGTRIMLLSMGRDPNPVEDQTRGTVKVPGTEDMEEYKDYCFHIKQSCIGMLLGLPACLAVGVITAIL